MKLGIVGLPNVGKSTLFNAITKAGAESANYPFCTIDPNVGVVSVPDERLNVLKEMYDSKKIVHTAIEFYDIAGLVRGASKGEGLGNKFLSHIREVASIVHVVRCFDDENVTHVDNTVSPTRDIETIDTELILSDLEMIDRRIERTRRNLKSDKSLQKELDYLEIIKETLESGKNARGLDVDEFRAGILKEINLLSSKPIIYVCNVSEDDLMSLDDNNYVKEVKSIAGGEDAEVIIVCGKLEAEISELEDDEKAEFLADMGLEQSGLDSLIKASYKLLGLISFLTAGPQEVRAWDIKNGTIALNAAGKIHSDIERGFIRAETVSYNDLMEAGNMTAAKDKGKVRLEGKEYIMKDGDIVNFRFNV